MMPTNAQFWKISTSQHELGLLLYDLAYTIFRFLIAVE